MYINVYSHYKDPSYTKVMCRKGLVQLFDKLEAGQLEESSLSRRVMQLHENRYLMVHDVGLICLCWSIYVCFF